MGLRRTEFSRPATALVAAVLGLDLLWSLVEGSTGNLAYGFVDEPAHLATCAVALLAVVAIVGPRPPKRFVVAALIASVAIDVDHIPGYLESRLLIGTLPRPYTHSLLLVAALVAFGWVSRRRRDVSRISLGLAFGVSAHLFRDLATGPGAPLVWPISSETVTIPYAVFASGLALAATITVTIRRPFRSRLGPTGVAGTSILVLLLLLAVAQPTGASAFRIATGAFIPGAARNPALIDAYANTVGRSPVIVSFYRPWSVPLVDEAQLDAVFERGAVPMVTWEPAAESGAGLSLWSIAAGDYDSYVSGAARAVKAWGRPVFLRFAHEMNGDWYPWGWGVNGNTPAAFKAAWRHVVSVFRAEGADNARWVWCPYVSNVHLSQFRRFYPGDGWVDWACLDGFNWGSYGTWQSFNQTFALSYQKMIRLTSRPLMIGEVGANEAGGNKPRWISRSLRRVLPRYSHVRALVWFDASDKRADFRVDSSAGSLAAIRGAFARPLFSSDRQLLLSTPGHLGVRRHSKRREGRAHR